MRNVTPRRCCSSRFGDDFPDALRAEAKFRSHGPQKVDVTGPVVEIDPCLQDARLFQPGRRVDVERRRQPPFCRSIPKKPVIAHLVVRIRHKSGVDETTVQFFAIPAAWLPDLVIASTISR